MQIILEDGYLMPDIANLAKLKDKAVRLIIKTTEIHNKRIIYKIQKQVRHDQK